MTNTNCDYCNYCDYSKWLRQSEYMLFCLWEWRFEKQWIWYHKLYHAFNKDVWETRYKEILKEVKEILKDLKLELNENYWIDEWKKVTNKQWIELSKIPEFDKKVVEWIIGFELDLKEGKIITIDWKDINLSNESFEELKKQLLD